MEQNVNKSIVGAHVVIIVRPVIFTRYRRNLFAAITFVRFEIMNYTRDANHRVRDNVEFCYANVQ